MRYRAEVENNKIKHHNNKYYLIDSNGNQRVVSKGWVMDNISYISNLSLGKAKNVYLVKDVFDKAQKVIIDEMEEILNSPSGFNMNLNLRFIEGYQRSDLPSEATITDAWDFIRHYKLDRQQLIQVFKASLYQAMQNLRIQGRQLYLVTTMDNKIIFTNPFCAFYEAERLNGNVTEI